MNKELLIKLAKLEELKIIKAKEELRAFKNEIALINCPFKVGDKLINSNKEKAIIEKIGVNWSYDSYKLTVRKIRNDGGMCKYQQEAHKYQGWLFYEKK